MSLSSLRISLASAASSVTSAQASAKTSVGSFVSSKRALTDNASNFSTADFASYVNATQNLAQSYQQMAATLRSQKSAVTSVGSILAVAPVAPTNLTVTGTTSTSVTITFTNDSNTTQNTVTATPANGSPVTATFSSGSPYTLTGLSIGTSYTISLVASNSYGVSSSTLTSTQTSSIDTTVHLLLHGESTGDSSSYNRAVTSTGTTGVTPSAQTFKVGSSSLAFPGDSMLTYAAPSLAVDTGDFTFECWFMLTAIPALTYIFNSNSVFVRYYSNTSFSCSGTLTFYTTLNLNQWYHVAYGRVSGKQYVYLDGTLKLTNTYSSAYATPSNLILGGSSSTKMSGYIDEARFVVGRSVYDGVNNFAPPTTPY